jgi:hypothetical protein
MSEELNLIIDGVLNDDISAEESDPNMFQIDELERLSMMTMFVWMVRQNINEEQRRELIEMILSRIKRRLIKKLGDTNLNEKQVQKYREEFVVQINNNIQVVEERLRRLFVDGIPRKD